MLVKLRLALRPRLPDIVFLRARARRRKVPAPVDAAIEVGPPYANSAIAPT